MVNTTNEVGMGIADKLFSYIKQTFQVSVNPEINQLGFMQSNNSVNHSNQNGDGQNLQNEKQLFINLIEKYKHNSDYYQFLNSCKKDVLSMYNSIDTISIDVIQETFYKFSPLFKHIKSKHITLNYEVKKYLLLYMMPVIAEYFDDKIAPDKLMGLQKMNAYTFLLSSLSYKNICNISKSAVISKYAINYYEKYFTNIAQTYDYLPSIFEHILEDEFNTLKLDEDIHYLLLNWTLLNESKALCKLEMFDKLESEEFQSLITRIKNMVLIGRYPIYYYHIIFLYINYFLQEKLISCTDASVIYVFKTGLTTVAQKVKYDSAYLKSFEHIKEESPLYIKIFDIACGINKRLKHQKNKELSLNLVRLLPNYVDMFFDFFTSKKNEYHFYPALSYLNSNQLFSKIIYMHKNDIEIFNTAIQKRYLSNTSYSRKNYIDDVSVLSKLKSDLSTYLNERNARAVTSTVQLNKIDKTLEKVINMMEVNEKIYA